ncbi:hypothetical protein [Aestuariivirga sp.]|uniref:hypothetical protein n=1 Tax=Aestuariivirga sp. TaxID=2650926 RepID=UPI003BAD8482
MNVFAPQKSSPDAAGEKAADGDTASDVKYRQDAANYVSAMVAELRQIAAKAGFDKLVTALDSAYYEAYGAMDGKARETPSGAQEKISERVEPKVSAQR